MHTNTHTERDKDRDWLGGGVERRGSGGGVTYKRTVAPVEELLTPASATFREDQEGDSSCPDQIHRLLIAQQPVSPFYVQYFEIILPRAIRASMIRINNWKFGFN